MKRRRRKKKSNPHLWIVPALAACICVIILTLSLREHHAAWPTRPAGRTRIASRAASAAPHPADAGKVAANFRQTVARAGGEDAWVRRSPRNPAASGGIDDSFEALVTPRVFSRVLAAIRREAKGQGLSAHVEPRALRHGSHITEVEIYRGREPVCRFELRELRKIARVAIVIDDLGQNPASARALLAMHSQFTFSVIPRLPYSLQTAEAAHRAGVEVMLHLPMQPLEDGRHDVSSDEIREGMSGAQVSRAISRDLASVPYAAGVNNHMGSRATSDAALMSSVMMALGREHLYFVDSRTTPDSVALGVARRMGVPAFYRSVFLDDVRTVPYTLGQLRKLCAIAEREGAALAIGHPYPTTIAALRQFLPEFTWQGIELTPASHLVRMPGIARLAPPHSHSM